VAATASWHNTRRVNCRKEPYDILIGRPSIFGNPWAVGWSCDRPTAIANYRRWILTQPRLLALLPQLVGKRLGCYCRDNQPCHGDVLIELINLMEHKP